jgi:hypothetical protein
VLALPSGSDLGDPGGDFPDQIAAGGDRHLLPVIANYVISQTFPMMDKNDWLIEQFHHAFPFWLYGFFCVILLLVIVRFVPETKNKTLEEIEKMWLPQAKKS